MNQSIHRRIRKTGAAVLTAAALLSPGAVAYGVEYNQITEYEITVKVSDQTFTGRAIDASYPNNTYLSLRSFAECMKGTGKEFSFAYFSTEADGEFFQITMGEPYETVPVSIPEHDGEPVFLGLMTNRLFVGSQEKKYYTYRYGNPEDLYMSLTDLQLLFDCGCECSGEREITFYPDRTFAVNLQGLQQEGFFDQASSVLAGDTETGDIFFATNSFRTYPIASTSKLMTYLLAADAIAEGRASPDDLVLISADVETMSNSEDGRIPMKEGTQIPLSELLEAMLVVSSNEAALAVAEHISGSEEAFTEQMNARAEKLSMASAEFYNCSGLPVMKARSIPSKLQNKMTIRDLFTLTREILTKHPEVTEITAQQLVQFPTLEYTSFNSNPTLFNNDKVNGLKTGSTKASGSCIVLSCTDGEIVIVLGAEDAAIRGRIAEVLLKSAP